jgi:hypothetical protein
MNAQQQSKLENRLKEIESIYYNVDSDTRHDLICERAEIEFQINKSNINFRLSGDNKYYYASHCKQFTDNLFKYGYGRKTSEEIKKIGISFHNHSVAAHTNNMLLTMAIGMSGIIGLAVWLAIDY